ncbi:GYD domain-containing protein [Halococcus sediminicola]|uniref:GYD domain-containing protein n=1 Tax=Halococcus sediminicola TaxID=1264579 RepID=UPI0006795913|nr:GYD domain-containing protein [Halococcus sediminicola]
MQTWLSLVEADGTEFQDLQELASLWGDISLELEEIDAEIKDTYALLGRYDFLLVFEAPDRDSVFELSLAAERHGLDMSTMEGVPIEHFGSLVKE